MPSPAATASLWESGWTGSWLHLQMQRASASNTGRHLTRRKDILWHRGERAESCLMVINTLISLLQIRYSCFRYMVGWWPATYMVLFLILIIDWILCPPANPYTSVLSGFLGLCRLPLYHVVSTFVILTLKVLCFKATPLFPSLYIYTTDFPAGLVLCSGTCYSDQMVSTTPEAHRYPESSHWHDPYPGLRSLPKTILQMSTMSVASETELIQAASLQNWISLLLLSPKGANIFLSRWILWNQMSTSSSS